MKCFEIAIISSNSALFSGTDRSRLLAVNVFLRAIVDFDAMNGVYDAWIDPANPPARACVEARLADPDLRVEMTAIAAL